MSRSKIVSTDGTMIGTNRSTLSTAVMNTTTLLQRRLRTRRSSYAVKAATAETFFQELGLGWLMPGDSDPGREEDGSIAIDSGHEGTYTGSRWSLSAVSFKPTPISKKGKKIYGDEHSSMSSDSSTHCLVKGHERKVAYWLRTNPAEEARYCVLRHYDKGSNALAKVLRPYLKHSNPPEAETGEDNRSRLPQHRSLRLSITTASGSVRSYIQLACLRLRGECWIRLNTLPIPKGGSGTGFLFTRPDSFTDGVVDPVARRGS